MKNLKTLMLIFCIALLSVSFASQEEIVEKEKTIVTTNYCRGFSDGYKEGYCYDRFGCIAPIPPVCPILEIGESQDSYKDGYNRGFKTGLQDRK